jgi:hypothetical protein
MDTKFARGAVCSALLSCVVIPQGLLGNIQGFQIHDAAPGRNQLRRAPLDARKQALHV